MPSALRAASNSCLCVSTRESVRNQENLSTAIFFSGRVTIFTRGSVGVGSVSSVYERGMPKAMVRASPSRVAVTGAVMAIGADCAGAVPDVVSDAVAPRSTTGDVMAMRSFFTLPPKM